MTPPNLPYRNPNGSTESHGSPSRGPGDRSSMRGGGFDNKQQRSMALA
jgi:hypothetical protein